MVEKYSEWLQACTRNLRNIKEIKIRIDRLKKEVYRFFNTSLSSARQNKHIFQSQYDKIRESKAMCDSIFSEMGRLGDAMKHYSNENKILINKYVSEVDKKYSQFSTLIAQAEAKERMEKKKAEEREKRIK